MNANPPIFRIVTSSALFDGHDASINVFRRLFQAAGLEVIHIGHNRSVKELVTTVIQEDADAVCVSCYQGAHMEFFRFLRDELNGHGCGHVGIFGGGGGTILPSEIAQLQAYGITRLYHAEDGRVMQPKGIVRDAISRMNKTRESLTYYQEIVKNIESGKPLSARELAKSITFVEQDEIYPELRPDFFRAFENRPPPQPPVIGLTGPGGCGKSSLVDELVLRYLHASPKGRVGILAFDPTKKVTGGALLGDRIRMNSIYDERVFLRSMATRQSGYELSAVVAETLKLMKRGPFDLIILETTGIGQGDSRIVDISDLSLYVMTSEYGASMQLEKIDMLDLADIIVLNKSDKIGAFDAFDDIQHAYAHAHHMRWSEEVRGQLPIYSTIAADFNDPGVSKLFVGMMQKLGDKHLLETPGNCHLDLMKVTELKNPGIFKIIPAERTFYLSDIVKTVREYHAETNALAEKASQAYKRNVVEPELEEEVAAILKQYHDCKQTYANEDLSYVVRDKTIKRPLFTKTLSNQFIPKIALPKFREWGDIVTFMRKENFPGYFPYTAGVFPLKSEEEDPKRQFAGEGIPERTNKRFHFLCSNDVAKRLSTAFDAVTLYGEDPTPELDVYGNIGNSGVSIATLDNVKALYAGFDLVDPLTSVSLTINGPAPMILAMFFNAAIDFEVQKVTGKTREELPGEIFQPIKARVLNTLRGTVQADILKEEQAQNECIFSSKFALKMMGDIQEYFIKYRVRNFYSASISGYHIAEAGANPISQLAFTLSNGFTLLEYYLSRGMAIDDFAPNLSFFFSCGLDPEYTVLGRVARRLWAIVLKRIYGANERSCKFKYHIQTSGRSLHAHEIAFNDIRTTLQAFLAYSDHCNSLHTNAYDEAITTPTEESVRRAMAIQLILTKEFGFCRCENSLQGSFFIEELTDLVENAVLEEFESLSRRGGVLGAMEKQYQRHRIQTESMKYEMLKASGELPVVGVNTFVSDDTKTEYEHIKVVRATQDEKQLQIARTQEFIAKAGAHNQEALERLQAVVLGGGNIFEELMETVRYCSLGQITHLLYSCGGAYRRSM